MRLEKEARFLNAFTKINSRNRRNVSKYIELNIISRPTHF